MRTLLLWNAISAAASLPIGAWRPHQPHIVRAHQIRSAMAPMEALGFTNDKGEMDEFGANQEEFSQIMITYLPKHYESSKITWSDPFANRVYVGGCTKSCQVGVIHVFTMDRLQYQGTINLPLPIRSAVADLMSGFAYVVCGSMTTPSVLAKVDMKQLKYINSIQLPTWSKGASVMVVHNGWLFLATNQFTSYIGRVKLSQWDSDVKLSSKDIEQKYDPKLCGSSADYECRVRKLEGFHFAQNSAVDRTSGIWLLLSYSYPAVIIKYDLEIFEPLKRIGDNPKNDGPTIGEGTSDLVFPTTATIMGDYCYVAAKGRFLQVETTTMAVNKTLPLKSAERAKVTAAVSEHFSGFSYFAVGGDETIPSKKMMTVLKYRTGNNCPKVKTPFVWERTDKMFVEANPGMGDIVEVYAGTTDTDRGNRNDPIIYGSFNVYFTGVDEHGSNFLTKLKVKGGPETYNCFPSHGPISGGTILTVNGKYFETCRDGKIRFANTLQDKLGAVRPAQTQNFTMMFSPSPPAVNGPGSSVIIRTAFFEGLWSMSYAKFTYYDVKVHNVIPRSAPHCGGTTHTMYGSGFVDTGKQVVVRLTIGGNEKIFSPTVTFVSPTQLTFTAPALLKNVDNPEQLRDEKTNGQPLATLDIAIAMNGQQFLRVDQPKFFYYDAGITDISPKSGPLIGGTHLLLHGYGFVDTSEQRVQIQVMLNEKEETVEGPRNKKLKFLQPMQFVSGTIFKVVMPPVTGTGYADFEVSLNGNFDHVLKYQPATPKHRFKYYGNVLPA